MSKIISVKEYCDISYSSDSSYPFMYDAEGKQYKSSNQNIPQSNSYGSFKFNVPDGAYNIELSFDYKVSSEGTFDKFNFTVTGTNSSIYTSKNFSGDNKEFTNFVLDIESPDVYMLYVRYSKDGTQDVNDDTAYVKNIQCSYTIDKKVKNDKTTFDWNASGRTDTFEVYLCDRSTTDGKITERELLRDVTACEITWNDNTTLKESGTISHIDDWEKYHDKLVRIYQKSTLGNEQVRFAWGTYKIASNSAEYDVGVSDTSTSLNSVLWYLEASKTESALQVPRGTNIIYYIKRLCNQLKIRCANVFDDVLLSKDITFSAGTSYISIINELLDIADYFSARCDVYGTVQLEKYRQPQSREITWTYTASGETVLFNNQSNDRNADDIPNVVIMIYENEDSTIVGMAKDKSSLSVTSTTSRGYNVTVVEYVTDVATTDQTDLQIQNELDRLAKQKLDTLKNDYDTWDIESTYTPISIRDSIRVSTRNGKTNEYTVKGITRTMQPGVNQTMTIRKYEQ